MFQGNPIGARNQQLAADLGRGLVLACSMMVPGCGGDGDVGLESDPVVDDAAYGDEPASATLTQALPQIVNLRLQVILLLDDAARSNCMSSACTTSADVVSAVSTANSVFSSAGVVIRFDPTYDWIELVDSTLNNSLTSGSTANWSRANDIANQYPTKIVVFLRKNAPSNFAYPPDTGQAKPRDAAIPSPRPNFVAHMGVQASFNSWRNNFSHELGHYLGLYHTHLTWSNCYPTSSGCVTTGSVAAIKELQARGAGALDGDRISDTPEDPGPAYWDEKMWDRCNATHPSTEKIGTITYTPDRRNVMSYFNCSGTPTLSAGQAAAIRASLSHSSRQLLVNRTDQVATLPLHNGFWGSWAGSFSLCPEGSLAYGVNLKSEASLGGSADDSGLNAVSLHCYDKTSGAFKGYAVSSEGPWGSWHPNGVFCSGVTNPIVSGNLLVEDPQGSIADDTSANGLRVKCRSTPTTEQTVPSYTSWGSYRGIKTCPSGTAVCGIRTRLEANQGTGDDTALNGVHFACCTR
jgi:hypothetical protein